MKPFLKYMDRIIVGYGYPINQFTCLFAIPLFHLSTQRTIIVCYQFFEQVRTRFGYKPIYTHGAFGIIMMIADDG